jgi:glutamate-ammonia-ligase adenylyltransferase
MDLTKNLLNRLEHQEDLEGKIDEIRRFKKDSLISLKKRYLSGQLNLEDLMARLSDIADAILISTLGIAQENLRPHWGVPRIKDNDGNYLPGQLALIGMGKLGGKELHFSSDLDVIFVFNKSGETYGNKCITNKEYFSRVTQRIINYLTLHTREGYAYQVDTELRPSGLAGTLVTALEPWVTYYHEHAQIWERQALLKARLVYASGDFSEAFDGLFRRLIFLNPFPRNLNQEINHLRIRIEKELAKESKERWHFKKGYGGIIDIEFAIQYLQLKLGKIHEDILSGSTLDSLKRFGRHSILDPESLNLLESAYRFYRNLEIQLELNFNNREGFIDPTSQDLKDLAPILNFKSSKELLEQMSYYREKVRDIYLRTLKLI